MTDKMKLSFLHPRTSEMFIADEVSPQCTAEVALQGLTQANFIDPAVAGRPYQLVLSRTSTQLGLGQTMAAAGVQNNDVLEVRQQGQGASPLSMA